MLATAVQGYPSFWPRPAAAFPAAPLTRALADCVPAVLPAGPCRVVHVLAKAVRERLEGGRLPPLVAVRVHTPGGVDLVGVYRHVEVLGPAGLWDLAEAVPGTDGRAVCVLVTTAALRVWADRVAEGP